MTQVSEVLARRKEPQCECWGGEDSCCAVLGTPAVKTKASSESTPMRPQPGLGPGLLLPGLHCPALWFLVFRNSSSETCHADDASPKG